MSRKPIKPFSSSPFSSLCTLKKRKILLISMASLLILTIFSLILFFTFSPSSATHRHHHLKPPPQPQQNQLTLSKIELSCKATRYPEICKTSLSQSGNLPQDPKPMEIIQTAISISTQNLKTAQSMVKNIIDDSLSNPNRSAAAKNCLEFLHNSEYRLTSAIDVLPSGRIKDARAWMSAALLYQYDSWSALKYVNNSQLVNKTMSFMDSLMGFTSNALSMVVSYDLFGDETASWKPPKTERDGFWENNNNSGGGVDLSTKGGCPSDLTIDVTVCKGEDVGCKYNKIQEAVDAAPDNNGVQKFVIKIKQGVYKEIVRVPLETKNVVFLGDGMGKTVISGSLSVQQPGLSTYNTATVGVSGDGFMARDITFENAAGGEAHQAVAFRSDSDLSVVENCEFLGNQDTVYAHSLRQFYKSCHIQGNVDFIFGNSAAIFQDSVILVCPRQQKPEKGETNALTAHGRTDPAQSTGFVFQNCLINGTDEYMDWYYKKPKVHKNYLGRPWKEYSRTVFLNCYFGEIVSPQGWMPWTGDFALSTLYYGEFENNGPGANISGRVDWSSQVPANHVLAYSVQNFIQGDEWIPGST